jgi:hypothetical protein
MRSVVMLWLVLVLVFMLMRVAFGAGVCACAAARLDLTMAHANITLDHYRHSHVEKYVWTPEAAVAMIKYIQSQKQQIWGFELGNEVNNRMKSCNLQPAQQAAAFASFAKELAILYPDDSTRPKLLGPDIGYLDPEVTCALAFASALAFALFGFVCLSSLWVHPAL